MFKALSSVLLMSALCVCAHAQPYPAKAIRFIVPFPAGGIADVFARVYAQKFSDAWGQSVVVENRAGAGGNIGAELVAKAPPDGYTLLMGSIGTHSVNISLFSKLAYDPVKDFAPVALVIRSDNLLVVHPSLPVKTPQQLIALARARPGQLVYASAGSGTAGHLAGELFKLSAKVDLVHVPYKGNVPAITDLMGGQTSMTFATMPTVLPQVKGGRLRAIAVTGARRTEALPEVPAMAEALPGFDVTNWIAVFAPAGTPVEIVAKINAEIMRIMRLPEIQPRLANEGAQFTPTTPDELAVFQKIEIAKWSRVIRESGVRVD